MDRVLVELQATRQDLQSFQREVHALRGDDEQDRRRRGHWIIAALVGMAVVVVLLGVATLSAWKTARELDAERHRTDAAVCGAINDARLNLARLLSLATAPNPNRPPAIQSQAEQFKAAAGASLVPLDCTNLKEAKP